MCTAEYDANTGQTLQQVPLEANADCLAFLPGSFLLFAALEDGTFLQWEAEDLAKFKAATGQKKKERVSHIAPSHDGNLVFFAKPGKGILYGADLTSGCKQTIRHDKHDKPVRALAASPRAPYAATAHADGRVRIWEPANEKNSVRWTMDEIPNDPLRPSAVCFHPSRDVLALGGASGRVRLVSIASVQNAVVLANVLPYPATASPVVGIAFGSAQPFLLAATADGKAGGTFLNEDLKDWNSPDCVVYPGSLPLADALALSEAERTGDPFAAAAERVRASRSGAGAAARSPCTGLVAHPALDLALLPGLPLGPEDGSAAACPVLSVTGAPSRAPAPGACGVPLCAPLRLPMDSWLGGTSVHSPTTAPEGGASRAPAPLPEPCFHFVSRGYLISYDLATRRAAALRPVPRHPLYPRVARLDHEPRMASPKLFLALLQASAASPAEAAPALAVAFTEAAGGPASAPLLAAPCRDAVFGGNGFALLSEDGLEVSVRPLPAPAPPAAALYRLACPASRIFATPFGAGAGLLALLPTRDELIYLAPEPPGAASDPNAPDEVPDAYPAALALQHAEPVLQVEFQHWRRDADADVVGAALTPRRALLFRGPSLAPLCAVEAPALSLAPGAPALPGRAFLSALFAGPALLLAARSALYVATADGALEQARVGVLSPTHPVLGAALPDRVALVAPTGDLADVRIRPLSLAQHLVHGWCAWPADAAAPGGGAPAPLPRPASPTGGPDVRVRSAAAYRIVHWYPAAFYARPVLEHVARLGFPNLALELAYLAAAAEPAAAVAHYTGGGDLAPLRWGALACNVSAALGLLPAPLREKVGSAPPGSLFHAQMKAAGEDAWRYGQYETARRLFEAAGCPWPLFHIFYTNNRPEALRALLRRPGTPKDLLAAGAVLLGTVPEALQPVGAAQGEGEDESDEEEDDPGHEGARARRARHLGPAHHRRVGAGGGGPRRGPELDPIPKDASCALADWTFHGSLPVDPSRARPQEAPPPLLARRGQALEEVPRLASASAGPPAPEQVFGIAPEPQPQPPRATGANPFANPVPIAAPRPAAPSPQRPLPAAPSPRSTRPLPRAPPRPSLTPPRSRRRPLRRRPNRPCPRPPPQRQQRRRPRCLRSGGRPRGSPPAPAPGPADGRRASSESTSSESNSVSTVSFRSEDARPAPPRPFSGL
eukprot:tig00021073_g18025.t1